MDRRRPFGPNGLASDSDRLAGKLGLQRKLQALFVAERFLKPERIQFSIFVKIYFE